MSSPRTPLHSPHPSFDFSAASYASYSPPERRQSKASSFNDSTTDLGIPAAGAGAEDGGGGLGNLADELAGAFSDGEDDYDGYEEEERGRYDNDEAASEEDEEGEGEGGGGAGGGGGGESGGRAQEPAAPSPGKEDGVRDSGVDVGGGTPSRAGKGHSSKRSLEPPTPNGRGHRRKGSEYDGSEYGSESDLDPTGMPARLLERMDEVESLARRGTERTGTAADGAFKRVTEGLRDLSSQANVEGGAA
ncbi:hypothetical protein VTH06DRAFT_2196, partial [Thermothelomyces fergusii]